MIICPFSLQEFKTSTAHLYGAVAFDINKWCSFSYLYKHRDGLYYTYKEKMIYAYHTQERKKIRNSVSNTSIGFELEVMAHDDEDAEDIASDITYASENNVCCEEDGSLYDSSFRNGKGFEIVSNYGDFNLVKEIAEKVLSVIDTETVSSHDTSCCGLHFHITNTGDTYQNAKFVVFWNDPSNLSFIKKFARRVCHDYAAIDSSKNKKVLSDGEVSFDELCWSEEKYNIVNVYRNTVEVRAFKGTLNLETFLACMELSYYSYLYCGECEEIEKLSYEDFLEWLPEESVYIKKYWNKKCA